MKKYSNLRNGFTLIELLVVIAIIGILAALVLTSLTYTKRKARDAHRKSDLRQIALAMEMAYNRSQAYPASANIPASITDGGYTYLQSTPPDPQGDPYAWTDNTLNNQTYCVGADLELEDFFTCNQNGCQVNNINCS